jgi:hypothetical protein
LHWQQPEQSVEEHLVQRQQPQHRVREHFLHAETTAVSVAEQVKQDMINVLLLIYYILNYQYQFFKYTRSKNTKNTKNNL